MEETKDVKKIVKITKVKKYILLRGTDSQIQHAKDEIKKLYADKENHFCKYETYEKIKESLFRNIKTYCQNKFNADMW